MVLAIEGRTRKLSGEALIERWPRWRNLTRRFQVAPNMLSIPSLPQGHMLQRINAPTTTCSEAPVTYDLLEFGVSALF